MVVMDTRPMNTNIMRRRVVDPWRFHLANDRQSFVICDLRWQRATFSRASRRGLLVLLAMPQSGQLSWACCRRRRFTLAACRCYNSKCAGDRNNLNPAFHCCRSLAPGGYHEYLDPLRRSGPRWARGNDRTVHRVLRPVERQGRVGAQANRCICAERRDAQHQYEPDQASALAS